MTKSALSFRVQPLCGGLRGLLFFLLAGLGILGSFARWPDVFLGPHIIYLDPDCYSRMTRVGLLLSGSGISIRHHAFENAPEGIVTHATGILDWLIVGFAGGLSAFPDAPSLAGALISPLLGALFFIALAVSAWRWRLGWTALTLAVTSPILAHGFSVGRPDHQALMLLLVGLAWICELRIWSRSSGLWLVGSAMAWGFALWVSLFEPLILLALTLSLRVLVLQKEALPKARDWTAPATFFGILLCALAVDGWRFSFPDQETRTLFPGWAATIGELKGASLGTVVSWVGLLAPALPLLLAWVAWKRRDLRPLAGALLMTILLALTLWTSRWGIFLAVATAFALPSALQAFGFRRVAALLFLGSLWPMASAWEHQLFPEGEAAARRLESRSEALLLIDVARELQQLPPGNVLAPWWISPALAYWSGRPFVAGSSHQSLPGIADTARFYLAQTPQEPIEILTRRKVTAVVVDDPARVVPNSAKILGRTPPDSSVVSRLADRNGPEIPGLNLHYKNAFFRIYLFEREN